MFLKYFNLLLRDILPSAALIEDMRAPCDIIIVSVHNYKLRNTTQMLNEDFLYCY